MTTCRAFEALLGSDDPSERAAASRHALECADCRAIYDAHKRLERRLATWEVAKTPPDELEDRVRAAVRRRLAAPLPGDAAKARDASGPAAGRWIGLAAALLLAVGLGTWIGFRPGLAGPRQAENLLVVDALAEARRAEREHARAIAVLERTARTRLARADDPSVPAAEAARLFSYRDRLASLESTIAEVEGYLRTNPAHPGARTVLLAAYRDKTETLREILALGEPT